MDGKAHLAEAGGRRARRDPLVIAINLIFGAMTKAA